MQHLIVSTCGTSLLMNDADTKVRTQLTASANLRETDLSDELKSELQQRIAKQSLALKQADITGARRLSAELNGILALYEGQPARGKLDEHILLYTDTYLGEQSSRLVGDWLNDHGINAFCQRADDLNTADIDSFRLAMNALVSWCEATIKGYRDRNYHVIFNLVGGFKSWQGFMQTLGMFYADEIVYIFDGSDQLLRIPRLPVEFESSAKETIHKFLDVFRKLDAKRSSLNTKQTQGVPETFLFQLGDSVELSPWGRIVWERLKAPMYRERMLEPLSSRLEFSQNARQQASKLDVERQASFNERMDDLSNYLDSDKKANLKRLDYKKLTGNPRPPSTHECDLWADKGAWRAFGHEVGDRFLVDSIGPGLH